MRRVWMHRGRWPRLSLVPTVMGDGRILESAETEALTGHQVAARYWAAPSERGGERDANQRP